MNKLTKHYAGLLTSAGCVIADDGVISRATPDGKVEAITIPVDGVKKILVLPTKHVLKNADMDQCVAFHPACENIYNGQSEVINYLTHLLASKLFMQTQYAVIALLDLCVKQGSTDNATSLPLPLEQLITTLVDVPNNTLASLSKVMKATSGVGGKAITLNLHLSRNTALNGTKHKRVCKLKTPIISSNTPLFGTKIPKKQATAIAEAYNIVFPEIKAVGSDVATAPYFDALVRMYHVMAEHVNDICSVLGKKHRGQLTMMDTSWFAEQSEMGSMYKKYISYQLPGNVGVNKEKGPQDTLPVPTTLEPKTAPHVPKATPPVGLPLAPAPAPAAPATTSGVPDLTGPIPTPELPPGVPAMPAQLGHAAYPHQQPLQVPAGHVGLHSTPQRGGADSSVVDAVEALKHRGSGYPPQNQGQAPHNPYAAPAPQYGMPPGQVTYNPYANQVVPTAIPSTRPRRDQAPQYGAYPPRPY